MVVQSGVIALSLTTTQYSSLKTIAGRCMASSDQVSDTKVVNIFLRFQMDRTSSKEYLAVVLVAKRT